MRASARSARSEALDRGEESSADHLASGPEGRVLAGRYRIERKIGAGGMGVVYLAEHLSLGRPVALKLLRPDRRTSDDAVKRTLREARALSAVEHDSIVRVLDAGETESGEAFIALEYLEGMTLKQLLGQATFLPWRWAAEAVCQVLSALEAMHDQGFVHRDIKPSNCFCVTSGKPLSSEPRIKLIDFGIARLLLPAPEDLITGEGEAIGTPAYLAPEQGIDGRADQRADVFCTGVTLHELLTGKLPVFDRSPGSKGAPRPPSAVSPGAGIPAALDAIVLRALESDPDRRFQAARAMREEIRAALVEAPAEASSREIRRPSTERGARAGVEAPRSLGAQEEAQLSRLHGKVERFWITGVLHGSLGTSALVPQRRTLEEDRVAGLGAVLESAPPIPVPVDRTMIDLFEEHGRSLLLLGEPGTGKTTQLLLVAEAMLSRGPRPVPVVFTLATWTGAARTLHAWMVEELVARYQVPASFAEGWLSAGLLLPLLDGLDEAPEEHRAACAAAIDEAVQTGSLPGLLVTSRTREYEALGVPLRLNAAIRQHRLTPEAVAEVFAGTPVLDGLTGERREQLLQLAESPLALTLLLHEASMTLRPGGASPDQLSRLLDAYVDHTLSRSGKRKLPVGRAELTRGLEHLAASMQRNKCAVFQLDFLQPAWLERRESLFAYVLGSRVFAAALYGGGFVLTYGLTPLENQGFHATLAFGGRAAMTTALSIGLLTAASAASSMRSPGKKRRTRRQHWLHVAAMCAIGGLVDGALLGAWEGHLTPGIMGFEAGVMGAFVLTPHEAIGDPHADVRPREALRFSWRHVARTAPLAIAVGVAGFLGSAGERDYKASTITMTYLVVVVLILGGLRGREVDESEAPSGGIRRSARSATAVGAIGGALLAALFASSYGIGYGLCAGLTLFLTFWLWYGGYAVIQHVVLRGLLHLEGHEYCDERYLDAAVDRALLHRVGGGCLFIHPLFASRLASRFSRGREGVG